MGDRVRLSLLEWVASWFDSPSAVIPVLEALSTEFREGMLI